MTSNSRPLKMVRRFFARHGSCGLVLPSGWYGRPHDNLLSLTGSQATDKYLIVELQGHITLRFVGRTVASLTESALRLDGFEHIVIERTPVGSQSVVREEHVGGEVKFVAPF